MSDKVIRAGFQDFLGSTSVPSDALTYWRGSLAATGYCAASLFTQLTKDDKFSGDLIRDMYLQLLGRSPDSSEVGSWRPGVESQSTTVAVLAQGILSSPEFFALAGGTTGGFVDRLYMTVLGRTPASGDRAYWVDQIDTSAMTRGQVARAIYQSAETRGIRVAALAQRYLQGFNDPMHVAYWRALLGSDGGNDVALAIRMARMPRYRIAAQTRF